MYDIASEYLSWLLKYSLPVIHGVLPEPYLTHYTLLAYSEWFYELYINLSRASGYLNRFMSSLRPYLVCNQFIIHS